MHALGGHLVGAILPSMAELTLHSSFRLWSGEGGLDPGRQCGRHLDQARAACEARRGTAQVSATDISRPEPEKSAEDGYVDLYH